MGFFCRDNIVTLKKQLEERDKEMHLLIEQEHETLNTVATLYEEKTRLQLRIVQMEKKWGAEKQYLSKSYLQLQQNIHPFIAKQDALRLELDRHKGLLVAAQTEQLEERDKEMHLLIEQEHETLNTVATLYEEKTRLQLRIVQMEKKWGAEKQYLSKSYLQLQQNIHPFIAKQDALRLELDRHKGLLVAAQTEQLEERDKEMHLLIEQEHETLNTVATLYEEKTRLQLRIVQMEKKWGAEKQYLSKSYLQLQQNIHPFIAKQDALRLELDRHKGLLVAAQTEQLEERDKEMHLLIEQEHETLNTVATLYEEKTRLQLRIVQMEKKWGAEKQYLSKSYLQLQQNIHPFIAKQDALRLELDRHKGLLVAAQTEQLEERDKEMHLLIEQEHETLNTVATLYEEKTRLQLRIVQMEKKWGAEKQYLSKSYLQLQQNIHPFIAKQDALRLELDRHKGLLVASQTEQLEERDKEMHLLIEQEHETLNTVATLYEEKTRLQLRIVQMEKKWGAEKQYLSKSYLQLQQNIHPFIAKQDALRLELDRHKGLLVASQTEQLEERDKEMHLLIEQEHETLNTVATLYEEKTRLQLRIVQMEKKWGAEKQYLSKSYLQLQQNIHPFIAKQDALRLELDRHKGLLVASQTEQLEERDKEMHLLIEQEHETLNTVATLYEEKTRLQLRIVQMEKKWGAEKQYLSKSYLQLQQNIHPFIAKQDALRLELDRHKGLLVAAQTEQLEERDKETHLLIEQEHETLNTVATLYEEKTRLQLRIVQMEKKWGAEKQYLSKSYLQLQQNIHPFIAKQDALRLELDRHKGLLVAAQTEQLEERDKEMHLLIEQEHETLNTVATLYEEKTRLQLRIVQMEKKWGAEKQYLSKSYLQLQQNIHPFIAKQDALRLELDRHKGLLVAAQTEVDRLTQLHAETQAGEMRARELQILCARTPTVDISNTQQSVPTGLKRNADQYMAFINQHEPAGCQ
ncbi:centrosomal protein of 290 kDa-like [Drosophila obscura]|uniref:centrosomal protein of 290 kDa-like n=1 Tax=Drosophila obscura TaxID=7282 RepID=UPI001BB23300|nr:centrosomal protein of 290 kDa-like [Drosophila obscura]